MHEYRYYIQKITKNKDDTIVLELGDIRGIPIFDFQPGQYVMIYYKDGKGNVLQKHTFSIASSPFENGTIRLGIRVAGSFTGGLMNMQEGDEIFVSGPYGNFTFKQEKHFDLVFIAGGVGITPFISALRYATAGHLPNRMTLLYSNRTLSTTLFLEEILELLKKNANLRALFSVTDEKLLYAMKNVVNRRLDAEIIQNFVGDVRGKTFFICGPKNFMEAMENNLKSIGVYDFQIEKEAFSMIPDEGIWLKFRNTAYAFGLVTAIFLLPFYFIQRGGRNVTVSSDTTTVAELNSAADALPNATPVSSSTAAITASPAAASSASSTAPQKNVVAAPTPRTKVS